MPEVTIRDLRNRGAMVIDRVLRGETLTVTRAGTPVAELAPIARRPLSADIILTRWRQLPKVDPARLRADLDAVLDPYL
ncbi:MAG: type II toxin-antitoxin system Phd/YefM family antitoxin [Geodermatophilaceae bacterium]|nr:type II toxin-antitoxin system prevent-host-death family antitoxin [Geodermatophilaceae bacterium]